MKTSSQFRNNAGMNTKIDFRCMYMIIIMIFGCMICFGIGKSVDAAETILRPDSGGRIIIASPLFVDVGDSLVIPAGTTIEFRDGGSIFAKGELTIGLDGYRSTNAQKAEDLVRGVQIIYSGSIAPIGIQGGMFTGFNMRFKGNKLLNAFQSASVLISSSTFESIGDVALISIYQSASMTISGSMVRDATSTAPSTGLSYALIEIYLNARVDMVDMRFESSQSDSAIMVHSRGTLQIDDSVFMNCQTAITAFNLAHVKGAANRMSCSGPETWSFNGAIIDLALAHKDCCASVIFIPGLQGSRLYKRTFLGKLFENQLWEPDSTRDVRSLFLNSEGDSINSGIYTDDIIERINILGTRFGIYRVFPSIYSEFIAYLKDMKKKKLISSYDVFPYDWRRSPADVPIGDLINKINVQSILASNKKVVLVAHSYGGFIVKEALRELHLAGKEDLIQAVIYVGVPETGVPQAIFSALHGDQDSIASRTIMDNKTMIEFAANMPSAHYLTPSEYFQAPIDIQFSNKTSGETITYASTTSAENRYSLSNIYTWLKQEIKDADRGAGQFDDSPIIRGLSVAPSAIVSDRTDIEKDNLYSQSLVLEDAFRSYSILAHDVPTPNGALYEYAPCQPFPIRSFRGTNNCINTSSLKRVVKYGLNGDGIVVFDGQRRRSGKERRVLLNRTTEGGRAITHASLMESVRVQNAITAMIRATSSDVAIIAEGSEDLREESRSYFNMEKVFGLDIDGYSEWKMELENADEVKKFLEIGSESYSQGIQEILDIIASSSPGALSGTNIIQTGNGWSIGSDDPFGKLHLKSLTDQVLSVTFREHMPMISEFESPDDIGSVKTTITESFSDIHASYGSTLNIDMQFVTPVPSRLLSIDIDDDGIGDMTIFPDQGGGGSGIGSSSPPSLPRTFTQKKADALLAIDDARISVSRLEIYALQRSNASMLAQVERYIRAGNPTLALLVIKKRQIRLAEISAQYGIRLEYLQKGLSEGILRGFRFPPERAKKDAEILKIRGYIRDLARLKIIIRDVEQRAIDLLI
jgi:hypothetical protein